MDIDFVIPWVDGNDPQWQKEKDRFSSIKQSDANNISRYRDWDLMKYWFRAIEEYTPWVRKIHFITWGHLPSFLDVSHPKIHIVRHEDYIPAEWLPTFSSHTIEMNIHRIPGLAEHFIYLNDDTFICRPMRKEDFFRKGLPCLQFTENPLGFNGKALVWQLAAVNDLGIINKWFSKRNVERKGVWKYFSLKYSWYDNLRSIVLAILFPGYFTGFKNYHAPVPYVKTVFQTLWEKEPEILMSTSSHKFRDKEDVNQWVAHWWQIASGDFYPRRMSARTCGIDKQSIDSICEYIKNQKYEMLCLNDDGSTPDFEELRTQLDEAFNSILPDKSSF